MPSSLRKTGTPTWSCPTASARRSASRPRAASTSWIDGRICNVQQASVSQQEYQSAEFLRLFETYTASPGSIGAKLNNAALNAGREAPLIVATGADFVLYPGPGRDPEVEGYRLTTRGFKELAAV